METAAVTVHETPAPPQAGVSGPARRRTVVRRVLKFPKSARKPLLKPRFACANFQRMLSACKSRLGVQHRTRSRFWVFSALFHGALIVSLSVFMLTNEIGKSAEPVTITDVTFHEPLPEIPITRPAELLLAEVTEAAEPFPAAQDNPPEEKSEPSSLQDAVAEKLAQSAAAFNDAAPAEVIHSVEADFSRVKYRGSARGVGGQSAEASGEPSAPPTPQATSSAPAAGLAGNGPVGITRGARPMTLSGGVYPKQARKEKREGTVELRVEVLANGRVGSIAIHSSSGHRDLDETALAAASHWSFQPALSGDTPVASVLIVPVRYRLEDAK